MIHAAGSIDREPQGTGLFIHSGWRSAGTWIWNSFRRRPGVTGFYEPLNELLVAITLKQIPEWHAKAWDSGHPETAPYFAEYAPLLGRWRRGVAGFHEALAFNRFFLSESESHPRLKEYLSSLGSVARSTGTIPVMKFCRSLGRVAWMRRHFPHATHAVVVREPLSQWSSSWRLRLGGNPYFLAMPLAILARNSDHKSVEAAAAVMGTPVSALRKQAFKTTYDACTRFIEESDAEASYRASLAFWVATGMHALAHADVLIESDLLAGSDIHRAQVRERLAAATALEIDLGIARGLARDAMAHGLSAGVVRKSHAMARDAVRAIQALQDGAGDAAAILESKLTTR